LGGTASLKFGSPQTSKIRHDLGQLLILIFISGRKLYRGQSLLCWTKNWWTKKL